MSRGAACLLVFLAAIPALPAAADDVREGFEVVDEIGVAVRSADGAAAALSHNPILDVSLSVRMIFPHAHAVGLGFDFGFDVSGADETLTSYILDLFYSHPWIVPTGDDADDNDEDHIEVQPFFGASIGWLDAALTTCLDATSADCNDAAKARLKVLDGLDAFVIGGRVGTAIDWAVADGFLHLGVTLSV